MVVKGRQRGWGKQSEKGERLFNTHLNLIVCLEEIVMLIKESIVEVVGLQLITKWRICVGSWCDSKNKGHLCPYPDPVEVSPLWWPEWEGRNEGLVAETVMKSILISYQTPSCRRKPFSPITGA